MKDYRMLTRVIVTCSLAFVGFQCSSAELTSAKLYMQRGEWDRAEEQLQVETINNPQDEEAWYYLGYVRGERQNWAGMMDAFQHALAISNIDEKNIIATQQHYWAFLYNRGTQYLQAGGDSSFNYYKAIVEFHNATLVEPDSLLAYKGIAYACLNSGYKEAAVEPLTKLWNTAKDEDAAKFLGGIYYEEGRFKEAINILEVARNLYPDNGEIEILLKKCQEPSASATPLFPPLLSSKVSFTEPSGNGLLEAEEDGEINVRITNTGKGDAYGLVISIEPVSFSGLSYQVRTDGGDIQAGRFKTIDIPIKALQEVASRKVVLTLKFSEANGFEPPPTKIVFNTEAFVPPRLIVSDIGVEDADGGGIIQPGKVVTITARIQNTGSGQAKDVDVNVRKGDNVFLTEDSKTDFQIGNLAPGEYKDIKFSLYTNNRATDVPVFVDITEHYGSYGLSNYKLPLAFNKPMAKLNEVVVQPREQQTQTVEISKGLSIDVDSNIPQSRNQNSNAVALILSISDYQASGIPRVKYARHDAEILREYLIKTLGFKPENILPQNPDEQLTYGKIQTYINSILPSYLKPDGSSDLFIYYTGHGAPSSANHDAYLVPSDCDPNYVNDDNAYSMKKFYMDVEKLKARHKMVVVDACFSGQTGSGASLLKNASPLYLRVNNPLIAGPNTVIFQSSRADQVSNWYDEKRHGMFTYFFLKGLQGAADYNHDGTITADELMKYINDQNEGLPYWSNRLYQRPQEAQLEGNGQTVIESIER